MSEFLTATQRVRELPSHCSSGGRKFRNIANSSKSFGEIFSPPQITSGQPNPEVARREPAMMDSLRCETARYGRDARGGGTFAGGHDGHDVGGARWDIHLRKRAPDRKSATTIDRLGAKATRIRQRFAGTWVNTMVLMSPMRSEIRTAAK